MPSRAAMGDQREWGLYLPMVWRALADPHGTYTYPRDPERDLEPAWWNPLLHVMRFSLGWADPALGLWHWYNAGRPLGDHRLRFIALHWGDDLDFFAAWLWQPRREELRAVPSAHGQLIDQAWWEQVEHRQHTRRGEWSLGNDSLHLWGHAHEAPADAQTRRGGDLMVDVASARAAVLLDDAEHWYRELTPVWRDLPEGAPGNWRVDVIVRPLGWLGTYRRSWTTGRFFSGKHRWHQLGCP